MANQTAALERQDTGTLKLTISIPWEDVAKQKEVAIENAVANAELSGFRKGKAPKKMVEEKLDPLKLQEEVLRALLPAAYVKAIDEHKLSPIMNPKIHVEKLEEEKPWVFSAVTAEKPEIKLGDYKDKVKSITAKAKIIIPGKEDEKKEPSLDEIVKAVLDSLKGDIPNILVEQEADRLLSQLLDDIKRLGMNLDQYLASTNRTAESLREEYMMRAMNDIRLEFALSQIAEDEKITVEEKEIEEAILKAKDEKEKKHLEANRYLLASIIRQQKSLDFLKNL